MRYLFIVGHPAHVHLFRNPARKLREQGHEILFGAISREVTTHLLSTYGMNYFEIGQSWADLLLKGLDVVRKDLRLLRRARDYRPDMLISTGSPYAAHVSALLSKPHLAFGDTEHATLISRLMLPFTDAVCTPGAFVGDLGSKHVRYNGYKELAYLHPRYYRPDPSILDILGIARDEDYTVLRFSAWDASHDLRRGGSELRGNEGVRTLTRHLEPYGRVIVTSERLREARGTVHSPEIPPNRLHDLISFARLYVGEGATMASEAGVLGVPWVFVSPSGRGFLAEQQQRYHLGFWEQTLAGALHRAEELLAIKNWREIWMARRTSLLAEKIDVTKFIVEFIEQWPDSFLSSRRTPSSTVFEASP